MKNLSKIAVPGIAVLLVLAGCQQNGVTSTTTSQTSLTVKPAETQVTSDASLTIMPSQTTQVSDVMSQQNDAMTQDSDMDQNSDDSQQDSGSQHYKTLKIEKDEPLYSVDVSYPETGNKPVDTAISDMINGQVNPYLQSVPTDDSDLTPGTSYSLTIDYTTTTYSPDITSFVFSVDTYTGGAHPNEFTLTKTFNMKTGKEMTLDTIFAPKSNYLQTLSKQTNLDLAKKLGDDTEKDMLDAGTTADPVNFQNFSLSPDGITFYFDPYSVAPYAAGPQTDMLTFKGLKAILATDWDKS